MEKLIHRYGMRGGAQCGAKADKFGRLNISITGVRVTCPACIGPTKEQRRAAALEAIEQAGRRGQADFIRAGGKSAWLAGD